MHLTPLEIKKQEFHKQVRGYKCEDVHLFLEMVADDVEQLLNNRIALEKRVKQLEIEITEFREIEGSLRDAMLMASDAKGLAQHRADAIVREAESKRQAIITDGESQQRKILSDVDRRREEIAFEVDTLERQRAFLVKRMREFVEDQQALLDEHTVTTADETGVRRPKNSEGQVVSLAKVGAIDSDDEELSRGAEAS
jgi:cell division initiation protein